MNPAWSVVLFTLLCGASQGLAVALAVGHWMDAPWVSAMHGPTIAIAFTAGLAGLVASFFHLGHPMRAWRAVLMWRTSWLSREVIVLPIYLACLVAWALMPSKAMALVVLAVAAVLWWCTAMIYAAIRFIQEWAHPLTLWMFASVGIASGFLWMTALLSVQGFAAPPWWIASLLLILLAWGFRVAGLRRNAVLSPKSTLSSATGIPGARLSQTAMGMTGGAFNTREFQHRRSDLFIQKIRWWLHGLGYAAPVALMGFALLTGAALWVVAAVVVQALGLVADRWMFFAQARHPQNLYYQRVS
jgi:DMSO reductase anchor subunit